MRKKNFWQAPRFWLGTISSLIFLWLAMREVAWSEVLITLQAADWQLILLGIVFILMTWGFFSVRWQVFLAPLATMTWLDSYTYIMIGYLGNTVFPLRLGDLARLTLISQRYQVNIGFTTAAGVLEKLLDLVTLVFLAALLMPFIPLPEVIQRSVQAVAISTLAAFVVVGLLARSQGIISWLESRLTDYLPQRITSLFFALFYKFAQGFEVTRSTSQMLWVSVLSLLAWGCASLALIFFVQAFQLAVPWQAGILVLVVTNLGGAIPSSPGAIGVYEFLTILALSVWLSDSSAALGVAIALHSLNLALTILLGIMATLREGISISDLATEGDMAQNHEVKSTPIRALRQKNKY